MKLSLLFFFCLIIADFNTGRKPNNLGQDWGAWNYNPSDPEQGATETLERGGFEGLDSGYSLRMNYDVQSSNPAFNGFWMRLGRFDATPYEWLSFYVRGPVNGKFTKRFKVELKNQKGERASYVVDGVSAQWQEIRIPFKKNKSVKDWSQLSEFVIVFDDILATYKEGTLYFDQIAFQE